MSLRATTTRAAKTLARPMQGLALLMSTLLPGCSGPILGARADTPSESRSNIYSDFDALRALGDPLTPTSGTPASRQIATAFQEALGTLEALEQARDEAAFFLDSVGGNVDTDPMTEAWLHVEEAMIIAILQATPSPPPAPVSVDVQRRALAGQIPPGELHLLIPGTGETLQVRVFDNDGRMRPEALRAISWALRDRRATRARTIQPRLVTMLYLVGQWLDRPLEVVSGYRIGGVNASRTSRHASGRACDFRVSGMGTLTLARFVEARFAQVGVGYYPTSGFVHLDVRDQNYYWIDRSGPGRRSRAQSRSVSTQASPADDVTLRSPHIAERELYIPPPEARE